MILITSDIHLTDDPRDAYRWEIFDWLSKQVVARKIRHVCLLGDLTDKKDNHSAVFANQVVDRIRALRKLAEVHVLMGNHDYSDQDCPFFRFVGMIRKPTWKKLGQTSVLFLPNTRKPEKDWLNVPIAKAELVLMHQTIKGAKTSMGFTLGNSNLEGTDSRFRGVIVSGDIHVPQTVGRVTYVGSPHPINFGDEWSPRALLYNKGTLKSIGRSTIRKVGLSISSVDQLAQSDAFDERDQVKVQMQLPKDRLAEWPDIRAQLASIVSARGADLRSATVQVSKTRDERRQDRCESEISKASERSLFMAYCRSKNIKRRARVAGRDFLQALDNK